jgi:hypothetical protein
MSLDGTIGGPVRLDRGKDRIGLGSYSEGRNGQRGRSGDAARMARRDVLDMVHSPG